ncbi:hypothetical protein RISK_001193 [Rhodopirellula islandica]|uniref:Uncharacterized protein n=1 Tax=Rhodopirellula islandica TaxID=595434 RepID=A0A0J1EN26_RHOIS|nr:hypothetical protein RISK_001193 [Rhodopirellula islandica]
MAEHAAGVHLPLRQTLGRVAGVLLSCLFAPPGGVERHGRVMAGNPPAVMLFPSAGWPGSQLNILW